MEIIDFEVDQESAAPAPPVDLTEHRYLFLLERRLTGDVAELEERLKHVKSQIRELLGDSDVGLVDGKEVVVRSTVNTHTFDGARFKAESPDLYASYMRDGSYTRTDYKRSVAL